MLVKAEATHTHEIRRRSWPARVIACAGTRSVRVNAHADQLLSQSRRGCDVHDDWRRTDWRRGITRSGWKTMNGSAAKRIRPSSLTEVGDPAGASVCRRRASRRKAPRRGRVPRLDEGLAAVVTRASVFSVSREPNSIESRADMGQRTCQRPSSTECACRRRAPDRRCAFAHNLFASTQPIVHAASSCRAITWNARCIPDQRESPPHPDRDGRLGHHAGAPGCGQGVS